MATGILTPDTALRPRLPGLAGRLFVGIAFSALGSGMSMPYLFVYLTQVRGLSTTSVGLVLSGMGAVSLLVSPVVGTLVDRFGPRPVLLVGVLGEAAGMALVATIHTLTGAWSVALFVAVFNCTTFPATSALITRMVPVASRQRAYGMQFMLMNAGFGVGGLVASMVVNLARPVTFEWIYLIDALTYLGYVAVLVSLPRRTGALPEPDADASPETGPPPGWRVVLRDRTLLLVVLAGTLLLTCSYAQMDSGFTSFAVNQADVPARTLGWAFAANTAMIVAGQLVTLRLVAGRRRSSALGITGLVWALAWAIIAAGGAVDSPWLAVACVVGGMAVFGAAETIWAPVMPALVNGLADERVRGRYNALAGMTWTVSGVLGPALAGFLVTRDGGAYWVVLCVGGCVLGALAFIALRHRMTPTQDGLDTEDDAQEDQGGHVGPEHGMPEPAAGLPPSSPGIPVPTPVKS
ncbi:MAG: MFS transporter [Actinocatenispora sp.]